ncbi:hypothetical protein FSP39_024847 [Pinctada imbricata]|uniref:PPM-type phosphatase domain-containing protein n=1 Tax=Pinctada imbricata TaxID=66713 RepID=A0AA88YPX7_PINIB|nr:hypothetical protein FSP39_024847 [Pinctada imbricata]
MLTSIKSKLDDAFNKVTKSSSATINGDVKQPKFQYSRPEFLNLNPEQIQVSRDFSTRPIVTVQEMTRIPWNAGYAESINGGKSHFNEDQAAAGHFYLKTTLPTVKKSQSDDDLSKPKTHQLSEMAGGGLKDQLSVTYFALFDGHAGPDAALVASKLLHKHIEDKLQNMTEALHAKFQLDAMKLEKKNSLRHSENHLPPSRIEERFGNLDLIATDQLVVGALESAFQAMDEQLSRERSTYSIRGGCAVIVAVFVLGKLFVANAGDSRAVICHKGRPLAMSRDMTPYFERERILSLGEAKPDLLHNEFTCLEYARRIGKEDIGKSILYRGPHMSGWSSKTADKEDLKVPLIFRSGNKSRLMQTIGVSRGFGDFDLRVHDSQIYLKPFLSPIPEVQVFDLKNDLGEDDVLIMATDGLWDVLREDDVVKSVSNILDLYKSSKVRRYVSVAQELVSCARGQFTGSGWKKKSGDIASWDDISCFVIPLNL